jgi:hypothetical protein
LTTEEKAVRECLSRRDPMGYYVVPARKDCKELLTGVSGIELEEVGGIVLVKTRSRSVAEKILRILIKKEMLVLPG